MVVSGTVGYLQPRGPVLSPSSFAIFWQHLVACEGLASTSYIFYQCIVATLVIVVVMVLGDVFPKKFHEFIDI